MSECESCGREDGHYLGCAQAPSGRPEEGATSGNAEDDQCAFGECKNPRRPKGKGPAPKYCTEHSDPKNRK